MTDYDYDDLRYRLWKRQSGRCAYCGRRIAQADSEVEHKVPLSRGGSNSLSNLPVACTSCNREKGNKTAAEYRAWIRRTYR